jgi:hypothetical protein
LLSYPHVFQCLIRPTVFQCLPMCATIRVEVWDKMWDEVDGTVDGQVS